LPPELASQIAAGEVVERPSSAIKELIENALDAGASRCDVEIDGGGVTRLLVSDDGSGMNEEDARLCVERHATSKLASLAALGRVQTFGFRGEALPSIASVSRFLLRTRGTGSDGGVEVMVEGGSKASLRPVGCSVGTSIEVRDLFYNVPARRKFLRAIGTESGHVGDVVLAAALACPPVTFTLRRDGRMVREWLRTEGRAYRVRQIFNGETLAECRGERGPLAVEAHLSRPEQARSGAAGLSILVNGRPVRDRGIAVAVAQAYGSVLERGRYPRGVVYLDLPPELVDVNVHPQKAEVRFADPRALTDAVYSILSRELGRAFALPVQERRAMQSFSTTSSNDRVSATPKSESTQLPTPLPLLGLPVPALVQETSSFNEPNGPSVELNEPVIAVRDSAGSPIRPAPKLRWSSLRFIAQVRQTFLICEGDDGLYVLDQHAAAERVTFTKLRRGYQARAVSSQALLFPLTIEVSAAELELCERYSKHIAEVGFDLQTRGTDLLSIHATPKLLQRASPERLTRDLLSELSRTGGRAFSDAVDLALATMACHGSVRAGDAMTPEAATALLVSLDDADFAGHCPHGRPVVTFTSWAELERKVGRR
jgi:DNA mismatch repair protein MutL